MKSSQDAFELIVSEEDSDQAYYVRHYRHFDWPQGASGPTIAIGYDCGYATPGEATADWTGLVSADTVAHIVAACGLKGEAAHAFVRARGTSVTIEWDQALQQFSEREMPKQEARLDAVLPNLALLSGNSYGAILSLGYNRGFGGFHDPGPRDAEMREIRHHMENCAFERIPDEFLSMRRLWPTGGDLWRRRAHEADLFRAGLGQSVSLPPAPAQRPSDRTTRTMQASLNTILKRDPPLELDGVAGDKTTAAVMAFQSIAHLVVDGRAGNATWSALETAVRATA